jgi:hypothetical protein
MRLFSVTAAALLLLQGGYPTDAWMSTSKPLSTTKRPSSTAIFNVPPPSVDDVEAFKKFASKQPPPASFFELQQDCIRSAKLAIKDGYQLLEVEFPPLPANVLELDDVSAYDVAQANLNMALEFAKGFSNGDQKQNVAILFPDESEAKIAIEKLTGKRDALPTTEIEAGITVSSLRRTEEGDDRIIKVSLNKKGTLLTCGVPTIFLVVLPRRWISRLSLYPLTKYSSFNSFFLPISII